MVPKQFYLLEVEHFLKKQFKFFLDQTKFYSKLDILSYFPTHSQEEFQN